MDVLPPFVPVFYDILRVLIIFLDAALFFILIWAAVELFLMRPNFIYDPRKTKLHAHLAKEEHPIKDAWQAIRAKAETGTPESARLAIIEADGLVDKVLKQRGYAGETFADRLATFNPHTTASLN